MSARGTNFLHQWLANNQAGMISADVLSIAELIQQLFADAKSLGISSTEIEEDTGSIYQAMLDAVVHHEGGAPE
ncbi:DUF768 domain-containing protein [Mesorhizobium sp. M1A.F.Ca.IN.020.06.1.1]|uniref:DUF768 domain-containing protein n=1 Tax=unclassified Mesorhizobium TaxID=325217 RepID=UPI000FCC4C58|nr:MULTISPECIES: DUF768 domain-containing protein [unclassified Mesorhizobium]RUV90228.1 DUF768 domain-containing protein [Mesorhizobium sp. M1A.F.Ca.IN.020.32.1.1]RUW07770.1 DUF768 domain-containing protein [Mesorhizobium sp. M1A.F.Ca.IN.022.05.2.1]RUW34004.1 DUF768 domain-containing protein [Mesorhizobium sp. M1A.F.Ca.IN.020.06.1.1]RWF81282.1 MAG: DUF768 domain-containing protein [Mesorhizobium sp.]RWG04216.1 MAG: DUF768 domain-containing protein [Mesorhizobium sp.]